MKLTKRQEMLKELRLLKSRITRMEKKVKYTKPVVKRFEYVSYTSYKFWELRETTGGYNASWGKIGYSPSGRKFYSFYDAEKMINQKLNKGYEQVL